MRSYNFHGKFYDDMQQLYSTKLRHLGRLRAIFEKKRDARGEEAEKALELCEFIKKGKFILPTHEFWFLSVPVILGSRVLTPTSETLALYALKKYRTLRRAYSDNPKSD